ncbi:hypothetical protein K503DRAFT_130068 [Rhizopogon vinicolor AM-OR11-026]|uniref:Uncharacterized protein n=1 Tax=Rhizopogon vinicolor AM-OR11-026 TaxID=1314800 RepID=A0A1B7N1Z3_9AGAM|nr:hypothetical protein K503DRAFT_130068 [Rhizopogon vinicolor AM-OR11-026]
MISASSPSSRPTSPLPDPWMSPPSQIQITRALSPQPRKSSALSRNTSTHVPAFSPGSSARSTPVSFPPPLPNAADSLSSSSMTAMSKEEKAAEMARRKEERRLVSVVILFVCRFWGCSSVLHSALKS